MQPSLDPSKIEQVRATLRELIKKARFDGALQDDTVTSLYEKISKLEKATEAVSEIVQPPKMDELERERRQLAVVEKIKEMRYPSYLYEFASTLTNPPFSLPASLFEPQGRDVVTIDIQSNSAQARFRQERTELALSILFPGSFTYRYFGYPIKVQTGQWHSDYTAHLRGVHILSSQPIFNLTRGNRSIAVFKPITLRAQRVFGRNFTCQKCLSVDGLDENCNHSTKSKRRRKLPSNSTIETRTEMERSKPAERTLRTPLSAIMPRIGFISNLKVGTALLGFERQALGHITVIEYDPPLGTVIETKGVVFPVEIPEAFITHVISNKQYLARDLFIQMLAGSLGRILPGKGIPVYNMEPSLSGMIFALGLDSVNFSLDEKLGLVASGDWIENAIQQTFAEGQRYYERFNVDRDRLRASYKDLAASEFGVKSFQQEVRKRLLHSLAHVILIAACVTSGSGFSDLKYLLGSEEILIFDAVNGGNGSSQMVFEFCTAEDFEIEETDQEQVKQHLYQPKHLDEALLELLLPCQQGIAERLFIREVPTPSYRAIRRRVVALGVQKETHANQYAKLSTWGVENTFPGTVGRHVALSMSADHQSAERLREVFGICVHGCPDCISIGSKCDAGGFHEKYHISKALIDEYVRFMTKNITVPYNASNSTIEQTLRSHNAVILLGSSKSTEVDPHEATRQRAMELAGKRVDSGFVKFGGLWIDNAPDSAEIQYRVLLVVT